MGGDSHDSGWRGIIDLNNPIKSTAHERLERFTGRYV